MPYGKHQREKGRVRSVSDDAAADGPRTVWVDIDFDGSTQGFGGLELGDSAYRISYIRGLCDTFGVKGLHELVGKPCYALRSWDGHQVNIEGLEAIPSGKRFTMTGWRRRMDLDRRNPLERLADRPGTTRDSVRRLREGFLDWEAEPMETEPVDTGAPTAWERLMGKG